MVAPLRVLFVSVLAMIAKQKCAARAHGVVNVVPKHCARRIGSFARNADAPFATIVSKKGIAITKFNVAIVNPSANCASRKNDF
jgi:hypothetical protein